jgi:hypothetical protein
MPDLLQAPAASHTGPDTCLSEILTFDLLHKLLRSDSKLLSIKMGKKKMLITCATRETKSNTKQPVQSPQRSNRGQHLDIGAFG